MAAVIAVLPEVLEGVNILNGLLGAAATIQKLQELIQAHAAAHPEAVQALKAADPPLAARLPNWLPGGSMDPQMQIGPSDPMNFV